jgi:amidase
MTEHESLDDNARSIDRRTFVVSGIAGGALAVAGSLPLIGCTTTDAGKPVPNTGQPGQGAAASDNFALAEATVDQLQDGMRSGKYTARSVAEQYLARIDALDQRGPAVNAIIELNPDALSIADALDAERKAKGPRGPMHGVPVLIKDNIATLDKMQTTAGSLALVGATVPRDAFIADRLRGAGAVILGKTNLSEWANFRSNHSTSGWSGRGGQTRNPYALDRTPSGSSAGSGAAMASNFAAAAVGTETDGSIVSPSSCNSLVGLKPTLGLLSRSGIVPISHSQDTPGPMCRTVRDAAIMLGAMAGIDPRDPATASSKGKIAPDYTAFLDKNGMKGARIGVARATFFGYNATVDKAVHDALDVMRQLGATIVDPADLETAGKYDAEELTVLLYDFKADMNHYLADLGQTAKARTMADLIAFNEAHHDAELKFFGQELMVMAEAKGPLTSSEYVAARAKCIRMSRAQGIDKTMDTHHLDAIVAPTGGAPGPIDLVNGDGRGGGSSSTPAAVAGYPAITVPVGYDFGLPLGMTFMGRAYSEGVLLKLAYAFEQAGPIRKPPKFVATTDLGPTGRPAPPV